MRNPFGLETIIMHHVNIAVLIDLCSLSCLVNFPFISDVYKLVMNTCELMCDHWLNVKNYSEGELLAGYQSEYFGIKHGLFFSCFFLICISFSLFVTVISPR
jgi:hypothetical protein